MPRKFIQASLLSHDQILELADQFAVSIEGYLYVPWRMDHVRGVPWLKLVGADSPEARQVVTHRGIIRGIPE